MSARRRFHTAQFLVATLTVTLACFIPAQADELDLANIYFAPRQQPQPPLQPQANSPKPLTLARLEELALANNPTLRQASAHVDAAEGILVQAGLYPNPVIGYQGSEIGNDGQGGQQGGFVGQEFITGGKRRLNRAVAEQQLQQAEYQLQAQRLRVLTAVHIDYYGVVAAQETLNIARDLLRLASDARDAAQKLFDAGQGTRPAALQADIEVQRTRLVYQDANNRYAATWRRLASVLGVPSLEQTPLEGTLDGKLPEFAWQETWDQLLASSPELQIATAGVRRAEYAVDRAEAEVIPNVSVQGSVQNDASTRNTIAGVQFSVPLPIFNRNQGNIQAAYAELRHAEDEIERVKLALHSRLATTFRRYQNASDQVQTYKQRILPQARESFDLTAEGYRRGQFDFLQLLTAQRTYFQSRLSYVAALRAFWQSASEIRGLLLSDGLADAPPR